MPEVCSRECQTSFDFERRQISAGKNRKKTITPSSHDSYATKMNLCRRPSPPVKQLGVLRAGGRDQAAPRFSPQSCLRLSRAGTRNLSRLPFIFEWPPPLLPKGPEASATPSPRDRDPHQPPAPEDKNAMPRLCRGVGHPAAPLQRRNSFHLCFDG